MHITNKNTHLLLLYQVKKFQENISFCIEEKFGFRGLRVGDDGVAVEDEEVKKEA